MNSARLSVEAANAGVNAICALLNFGTINIYSGPRPLTPNSDPKHATLLSTIQFGSPAFGPASNGVATANALEPDENIASSGKATWARLLRADGLTAVCDVSVGASDLSDIVVDDAQFETGGRCTIKKLSISLPKSA